MQWPDAPAALDVGTTLSAADIAQGPANGLPRGTGGSMIVALGGIQVLAMLFTVARSKAVAFTLGPPGVGAISLIDQVAGLVGQVTALSLPFAAMKFLSAAHSESREQFAALYRAFAWALLALSVLGTGVSVAALWWWPTLLGRELAAYGGIATLAFLSIPGVTLTGYLASAMASAQRTRASGLYGLWSVAALAVLSGAGVAAAGLRGYYLGSLVAVCGVSLAGVGYLARCEGVSVGGPQTGLPQLRRHRGVIAFAFTLYIAAFAQPAAFLVARYAVLKGSGLEGAGLLQSAMALGLALFVVMRQPSSLLLVPALNRNLPNERKFREAAQYMRSYSLIIGGAALPLVLFPELLLYAMYSRRFLSAAPHAYLFVIAQVLKLFAGVSIALLVGLDQIATQLVVTLTGFGVLALLSWALAPSMGIAGVGVAFLAEGVLVLWLATWWLRRRFRFPIAQAAELPLIVLAIVTIVGAAAARYAGLSFTVVLVKVAVWAFVTLGGLVWAWRTSLLHDWVSARRGLSSTKGSS